MEIVLVYRNGIFACIPLLLSWNFISFLIFGTSSFLIWLKAHAFKAPCNRNFNKFELLLCFVQSSVVLNWKSTLFTRYNIIIKTVIVWFLYHLSLYVLSLYVFQSTILPQYYWVATKDRHSHTFVVKCFVNYLLYLLGAKK